MVDLGAPTATTRRALIQRGGVVAAASALFGTGGVVGATSAAAATLPDINSWPSSIEGWAAYDGQTTCSPTAKPGVTAFLNLLTSVYPSTGSLGITRACNIGGRSEHKEGRALDWRVNVNSSKEREIARQALYWLLSTDKYGHWHAMARRLGMMYVIWNRRIWKAYSDPERWHSYTGPNPHTDHVHFSFSRRGAAKQTSFWTQRTATVVAADASATAGALLVTSEGAVDARGSAVFQGSMEQAPPAADIVDVAVPPAGGGYLLADAEGHVYSFGATEYRGGAESLPLERPISGIAASSRGGYWLAAEDGGVFSYGDAPSLGSLPGRGVTPAAPVIGIAATPSGQGFWLASQSGEVFGFGDAQPMGSPTGAGVSVTGIAPTATGRGYWLAAADGQVFAYGDATLHGALDGMPITAPIAGISPTATGRGYQLVGEDGGLYAFGDAVDPVSAMPDH